MIFGCNIALPSSRPAARCQDRLFTRRRCRNVIETSLYGALSIIAVDCAAAAYPTDIIVVNSLSPDQSIWSQDLHEQ